MKKKIFIASFATLMILALAGCQDAEEIAPAPAPQTPPPAMTQTESMSTGDHDTGAPEDLDLMKPSGVDTSNLDPYKNN